MSEREEDETTKHGEPLWWSEDESDKIKAKLTAMESKRKNCSFKKVVNWLYI
jgi:hypothetical protein